MEGKKEIIGRTRKSAYHREPVEVVVLLNLVANSQPYHVTTLEHRWVQA